MKKTISVFLIVLCCTVSFVSCGKDIPEIGNMDEIFPQAMGDVEFAENFEYFDEITEKDETIFNSDINIYYTKNRYSLTYKNELLKNLGLRTVTCAEIRVAMNLNM